MQDMRLEGSLGVSGSSLSLSLSLLSSEGEGGCDWLQSLPAVFISLIVLSFPAPNDSLSLLLASNIQALLKNEQLYQVSLEGGVKNGRRE